MATYINCTETAKLIRKALKENFPGIKFSVKKSQGGSSVYVRWTDGPADKAVEKVVKFFEGATFDCSIDLKSYVSVEIDGEEVQFGADYVICQRDMSYAFAEAITKQFCQRKGIAMLPVEGNEQHAWVNTRGLDYYYDQELRHLLMNTDVKDMDHCYTAKDEQEARERAEWEAGAAERERQAKAEQEKWEQEEKARREREAKAQQERQQREREEAQRRQQQQERDAFKAAQRMVLSSKYSALIHLGLSMNANNADVLKAFRNKVKEMSDGQGGYVGDMDFLVKVKEKALQ